MLRLLVNSYTCCPNMGSEPGMGWNWIISLSKYCDVYVITESEYRRQIEEWCGSNPEQSANLHFFWNTIGGDDNALCDKIRKMCWNQGDWRFYRYYKKWQKDTAAIARDIIRGVYPDDSYNKPSSHVKIDILHQLNMIGFREPGYLWEVSRETGVPFVWGPVDAKEGFPMSYVEGAPVKNILFLHVKNIITKIQLLFDKRVRCAANRASIIFSATSNSALSFRKYLNKTSTMMNETGCSFDHNNIDTFEFNHSSPKDEKSRDTFRLLWVGKFDFRKQLQLAIRCMSLLSDKQIELHIVGSGNADKYKEEVRELNMSERIMWRGQLSHEKVQRAMCESDLLFFTSVAEGTPHVVLEALSNGLPVLCFDTCGQGDSVDSSVGIKIPLTNPSQSVCDFAEKISYLYTHPEELKRMSLNCRKRAEELSWDNKARQVIEAYQRILR